MTLTKADLIESLAKDQGLSKAIATDIVEQIFEEMRVTLEQGEDVKLSGLGKFQLRDKNQRPGRNPKTGEDMPISARRVVSFKAGQKLKQKLSSLKIKPIHEQSNH